jgi:hypothetical protein
MSEFLRLFLATLLGAGVSFGTTFYFQRRKELLDRGHAEEADRRELRRALRLVGDELVESEATIAIAREAETWWNFPPTDLSAELWQEWRSTLADLLDDHGPWDHISNAFAEVADLNLKLAMFRAGRRYPNEMASHIKQRKIYNEGWSEDHSGDISPPWDDLLMRIQTAIEIGNREISLLLFPDQEPPEIGNPPSRLQAEVQANDQST